MLKTLSFFGLLCLILSVCTFSSCEKDAQIKTVRDTIKVIDTLDIDRPINLRASKGIYGSKITISWTPMPLAQKYQLYKFNEISQKYILLKELSDTTFDDAAISKSLTKNFYKVRTANTATSFSRFSDADFGYTSGLTYYQALSFGSEGTGPSQFNFNMHVEADKANNIYVSDEGANRVLKFDQTGKFLEQFYSGSGARAIVFFSNGNYIATRTQSSSYIQIYNANKQLIREWGTYGAGDSNFGNVEEIALDDEQNIWIVDGVNHRIKKYDQNGNLLLKFGKQGSANGDFDAPFGICYFKNKIYVSDTRNSRVQVFDKSGKYLKTWTSKNSYYAIKAKGDNLYIAAGGSLIKTDENGDVQEKIGQFQQAVGVALGVNDEVIACDVYARKIVIFKKG
ncbi:NHL repeat-containing protein [Pedobacter punctiformis]|uniref:NHL repeat-containing protein n=1 Tax=Pedobacter punctiformis TaxID=3004097 RepID=A0ABT4LEB6_9SPHI|nr:NHL repeat-containing protein [Pedobacter sp. HCMS5-2]MCZ4245189.1 NHL repeat-containing protein [Pedobacter sp. HCMS5-2]